MKIDAYCICKNEVRLVPFMVDYWKALCDDINIYVYDGHSTDGTIELLKKYDFVKVIYCKEIEIVNNLEYKKLKNNVWKNSIGKCDFVMVCDFDETIFSYDIKTLREELELMKNSGCTILKPHSFTVVSDNFPKYEEGKFLHEIVDFGFNDYKWQEKTILFDPNKIEEINFTMGGHTSKPTGVIKYYNSDKLFLIHAKFLGFDYFKDRIQRRLFSGWDLTFRKRYIIENTEEHMIEEFNNNKANGFKFSDIKENFSKYYNITI